MALSDSSKLASSLANFTFKLIYLAITGNNVLNIQLVINFEIHNQRICPKYFTEHNFYLATSVGYFRPLRETRCSIERMTPLIDLDKTLFSIAVIFCSAALLSRQHTLQHVADSPDSSLGLFSRRPSGHQRREQERHRQGSQDPQRRLRRHLGRRNASRHARPLQSADDHRRWRLRIATWYGFLVHSLILEIFYPS